jgi:hypothetical protein
MYLFLGDRAPLLAIRAVDHRTRTELRASRTTTRCQQSQRIPRVGRFGLGHSPREVHQCGRPRPRRTSLMTANRRATHGGRVCRLAGVSVSSRDARWKDHQEHLAVYRRPSPDGISHRQVPDRRKKAPQPASGRLSRRKLLARSYFPFFGPFFSSFLAFFFIRISSSRSAHDPRHRQPFVLDLHIRAVSARVKTVLQENEKQAISVWPRGNNPRGSGW